jgi:hypothetical protein
MYIYIFTGIIFETSEIGIVSNDGIKDDADSVVNEFEATGIDKSCICISSPSFKEEEEMFPVSSDLMFSLPFSILEFFSILNIFALRVSPDASTLVSAIFLLLLTNDLSNMSLLAFSSNNFASLSLIIMVMMVIVMMMVIVIIMMVMVMIMMMMMMIIMMMTMIMFTYINCSIRTSQKGINIDRY